MISKVAADVADPQPAAGLLVGRQRQRVGQARDAQSRGRGQAVRGIRLADSQREVGTAGSG